MKKCRTCKKNKLLTEFHSHASCSQGVRPDCKVCLAPYHSKKSKNYVKNNPEKRRSTILFGKYGIDHIKFDQMLIEQNYQCKICGSTDPGPKGVFAVDHCHKTSKVRGLLCYLCNMGLGSFKDNTDILQNAIQYLKESN